MSSGVIASGGLALHPLCILAVTVFWSGWMSLASSPDSPCISHGLSPVWTLRSILVDRSPLAEAMNIEHFSWLGGCMLVGSGV